MAAARTLAPVLAALLFLAACAPSGEEQASQPNTPIAQTGGAQPANPAPERKAGVQPAGKPSFSEKPGPERKQASVPLGEGFDFYVLALSWSPSYCEAEGPDANRQQCDATRPYAFVVHGLWPQFERGYPEDCGTDEPSVSSETLRSLYDIMPSAGLIRHEWRQHGTCSGLAQRDYFKVLRAARNTVVIPPELRRLDDYRMVAPADVEKSFLQSNPGLPPDGMAIGCDKRYLREVRICMTKALGFRACGEIDRRACRLPKAVMPPVRGG